MSVQETLIASITPIYGSATNYPTFDDCNIYGFREHRQYKTGQAIALGCSYTYGDGLDREHAWPYQLEQLMDIEVYNFGVQGGAFDTIVRLAYYWIHKIQPKYVFVALQFVNRLEYFKDESWHRVLPKSHEFTELLNERNVVMNYRKNMIMLNDICRNTTLIIDQNLPGTDKLARDKMHPGSDWHKKVAESFSKKVLDI